MNESTLVRALIPQAGLVNEPKQWYVARGYSLDRRNKFFLCQTLQIIYLRQYSQNVSHIQTEQNTVG